jgi:hypothetical protein
MQVKENTMLKAIINFFKRLFSRARKSEAVPTPELKIVRPRDPVESIASVFREKLETGCTGDIDAFFCDNIATQRIPVLTIHQDIIAQEAEKLFGVEVLGVILQMGDKTGDYEILRRDYKYRPEFTNEINCLMHMLSEHIDNIPKGYDIETISTVAWMYWRSVKNHFEGKMSKTSGNTHGVPIEELAAVNRITYGEDFFKALISAQCNQVAGLDMIRKCVTGGSIVGSGSSILEELSENAIHN